MALENWIKLSLLTILQSVAVVLNASFYQREYSGYLFTTPGANASELRTQVDARTWCKNYNGNILLSIVNSSVQNAVAAFINDAIRQNQLTTADIITDGRNSFGEWSWVNQVNKTPLQIDGNTGDLAYSYGHLNTSQSGFSVWADIPTNKKYYICEGKAFCRSGYQIQSNCFQAFTNETLPRHEARNRCYLNGGDLAYFDFISSNKNLSILNGSWLHPNSIYWIGLRRQFWNWNSIGLNGFSVKISQWSDGHPVYYANRQCICLLPNSPTYDWKWSECDCTQARQFVCIGESSVTVGMYASTTAKSYTSSSRSPSSSQSTNRPITVGINAPTTSRSSIISSNRAPSSSLSSPTNIPENTSQQDDNTSVKGLAIGLGVGLGIGVLVLVAIIAILVFVLIRRKRNSRISSSTGTNKEATDSCYEPIRERITDSPYQELNVYGSPIGYDYQIQ